MILHLLPDDKFIMSFCSMAIKAGALLGVEQVFMVRDSKPYKYLPEDTSFLVNAPINSLAFNEATNKLGAGDRIIIHFMHPLLLTWLSTFETKAKIEWIFWSSDFYTCMYYDYPDYDPLTEAFLKEWYNSPLSRYKLLHWFRKYKRASREKQQLIQFNKMRDAAVKKIAVFHHFIREEYEKIKEIIPLKATFNLFSYSLDMSFDEIYHQSKKLSLANSPINIHELNLMVGHSAYPYVNHPDSFEFLKDKTKDVNIVVPLSYGDAKYIAHVKMLGEEIFGNRFFPFMDYMSFEQYLVLLMSCNGLFVSLNTPKAMGNIHTMLILGKRVFIKKESLKYAYFQRQGIKVNTIDEFSRALLLQPEDEAVVNQNVKKILENHSGSQHDIYVENMLKLS